MKTGKSETKRNEEKRRETDRTSVRRRPPQLFSFLFVSLLFFSFLSLGACKKAPSAAPAQTQSPAAPPSPVPGVAPVNPGSARTQAIGVTYGTVEERDLVFTIEAPGRIGYDPELYSAIEEYRQALETKKRLAKGGPESRGLARGLVKGAADKLRLLGFSLKQIASLSSGTMDKEAQQSLILPREKGSVWVYAQVYAFEAGRLKRGEIMKVTAPGLPGQVFTAPIVSIDPTVDSLTRTVRVRGRLANPEGRLRPDDYVRVEISIPLGRRLSIPASAALETGKLQYVFVAKEGGELEPRKAVLGEPAGDFREVLSGLEPGERVVTSADFLIDSEARFEDAAKAFEASHPQEKKSQSGEMPGMRMMPGMQM